jgi:osmotically-inducible protein OsmY
MGKAKDIREAVEEALGHDRILDAAGITVKNLDGSVVLVGTVPSYPQYLEAAKAARRAGGVTRVHNHLEVVLAPEDCRDDAMLTTAANSALAASAMMPEGVEATADNGNITLTGSVKFPSQRAAAEAAVSGLTGVRNVKNKIGFVFDVDPEDVARLVKEALDRHPVPLDDSHVVARASGNTVTLVGHVRTRAQRDAAAAAAWRGHAVMAVINELEITA